MKLEVHPADPPGPVRSFDVGAAWSAAGELSLAWRLTADLAALRLPPPSAVTRADGLWRHTCFEAFIAVPGATAYREFNFAPSGEWAAYAFEAYRRGGEPLAVARPPVARWSRGPGSITLQVVLEPAGHLAGIGALRLGLAAVIESRSGTISHWALGHPRDRPDFHDPAGFRLALAAPATAGSGFG